ncbi:MAG: hypothetical protein ACP5T3_01570 [Candidatus Micrarchaeia archaeon]
MAKPGSSPSLLIIIGGILATLSGILYVYAGLLQTGAWIVSAALLFGLAILILGVLARANGKRLKRLSLVALIFSILYFIAGGMISVVLLFFGFSMLSLLLPLIYLAGFLVSLIGSIMGVMYKQ